MASLALLVVALTALWWYAGGDGNSATGADADPQVDTGLARSPVGESAPHFDDPRGDASPPTGEAPGIVAPPAPTSTLAASPVPRLTAAQARAAMQSLARERDCVHARSLLDGGPEEDRYERTVWQWMPPEQVASERLGRQDTARRLQQGCAPAAQSSADERRRLHAEMVAAAALAGDPEARLQAWKQLRQQEIAAGQQVSEERLAELRALLAESLLSGDLELIAGLDHYERDLNLLRRDDPESLVHGTAWPLVACDLGLDCGPTSRVLDRLCARTRGACGAAGLETAYRYTLHPGIFERIQARRAQLLARIRSGESAAIFAPEASTPGGP